MGAELNLEEKIQGYPFSVGWLLESLQQYDKEFRQECGDRVVSKVDTVDVSVGKGFASAVIKCVLHFEDSRGPQDVYTTILKIPNLKDFKETSNQSGLGEVFSEEMLGQISRVHQFECDFYAKIAPLLDIPLPRVFQTVEWVWQQKDGVIHMEDLGKIGRALEPGENVNLAQIKSLIRALARMHHTLLTKDESLWRGVFPGMLDMKEMGRKMLMGAIEPFYQMCKREAELRPLIESCMPVLFHEDFMMDILTESWKELGIQPVIAHGDCWAGNIMWKTDEQGEIVNDIAAIIDWQLAGEGSPMADVARMLVMSATGPVRRQAEAMIVDYYLECLQKKFGEGVKLPYTKEQLEKSYKLNFMAQSAALFVLTMFFGTIVGKRMGKRQVSAFIDQMTLNTQHGCEDIKELLDGEFSYLREKYVAQ